MIVSAQLDLCGNLLFQQQLATYILTASFVLTQAGLNSMTFFDLACGMIRSKSSVTCRLAPESAHNHPQHGLSVAA